jgi:hypothetical protein
MGSRFASRLFVGWLASWFFGLGAVLTVGFVVAAIQSGELIWYVAPLVSFAFFCFGVFAFTSMPFDMSCSSESLNLAFLTGARRMSWNDVQWYRAVSFVVQVGDCSALWILLKYVERRDSRVRSHFAFVAVPATGPAFGAIDEFQTVFDSYAPEKRRVRRRPPEIWLNPPW